VHGSSLALAAVTPGQRTKARYHRIGSQPEKSCDLDRTSEPPDAHTAPCCRQATGQRQPL
jgi:hypothetical protein